MTFAYWIALTMARAGMAATCGFEVIGRDKRIESGGAIIAANHASYLDPPVVACAYEREIAFLARSTLFTRFGAWLYPRLNAYPIDRDQADIKSMKLILKKLRAGNRVLVFPEGTRTSTGQLQPAKAGLGMLVARSGVPVQPVRIFGTFESWPRGGRFRPEKVTVVIGDPVEFTPSALEDRSREGYQHLVDRIMEAIGALCPD